MEDRKKLAQALAAGGEYAAMAEQALTASMKNTIKQRTMQQTIDYSPQISDAAAEAAADAFISSPQGIATIAGAVNQAKAQMAPLAGMTDEAIDAYAKGAAAKIAPLLSVQREFIVATFAAIDAKYSTITGETERVIAYLKTDLGLSDANIAALKTLYLE
jgi:hypothetical protein